MYRVTADFHNALMRGEKPVLYCVITTHMGKRVYAAKELQVTISDALEKSARVLDFGSFERTAMPLTRNVLTAYSSKQLQHIRIQLDNSDAHFAKLSAKEPFLSRPISVYVGFESIAATSHLSLFTGKIVELSVLNILTIEAKDL